jgi:acetylornithine deacetylase/succinyl-diaminopimelate desuccinylase-like protein
VSLLLVGNEENGEGEAMGTPHVLQTLAEEGVSLPELLIAGERTGEKGDELWGEICTQNRGVMRFEVIAHGERGHSGLAAASAQTPGKSTEPPKDITERLLLARAAMTGIFGRHLTLSSSDGWRSQAQFPFIQIGIPGIYNISPDTGVLGVEIRPIPQDDLDALFTELQAFCTSMGLELQTAGREGGIICRPENPSLQALLQAVENVSGQAPRVGRKLPGTSARFAPGGQGVVWGQTGIGPHAKNERHFIPSILPYYRALDELGRLLKAS